MFNLKQNVSDLKSANEGMSRASHNQVPPSRDVTQNNFPNGVISFKFQNSGQQWWIPSQSYIRIRCSLTKADNTQLADAQDIRPNIALASNLFQSAELRINDKTVSRITDFMPQVDALETRLSKSKAWLDSVGKSTNLWGTDAERLAKVSSNSDGYTHFEICWTPPLSIFKIDHALPAGKYELVLNPQSSSSYQIYAIESEGVASKGPADYKFQVEDMYLYNKVVDGARADDVTFLLDLESTTCHSEKVDSTNLQQKNFDVSPSTYALSVAYQDLRAGSDTRISASKFKSYNAGADSEEEHKLNRFFLSYAGQNLPQPDANPQHTTTNNYVTQRYIDTQIHNGAMFDTGGAETQEEWEDRGSYNHYVIPKDGTDRSTRVVVNSQFDSADVANMRMLLFSHHRQVARVQVQDGRVVDVQTQDA